jgi:hypothetical protein
MMGIPSRCRKANATVLSIVKGKARLRAGRKAALDDGCAQRRVDRRSGRRNDRHSIEQGNSYGKASDLHHQRPV